MFFIHSIASFQVLSSLYAIPNILSLNYNYYNFFKITKDDSHLKIKKLYGYALCSAHSHTAFIYHLYIQVLNLALLIQLTELTSQYDGKGFGMLLEVLHRIPRPD